MDSKTSKLTEMTMSNHIFGQSLEKDPAIKLKPKIKKGSYFTIFSDFVNPDFSNRKIYSENSVKNCSFIVSDEISRSLAIISDQGVQEVLDNITPQGLALIDGGKLLVVIDKHGGGSNIDVPTLNFYSLNENNKFTLIDKTCRTIGGNLVSCLVHENENTNLADNKIGHKTNSFVINREKETNVSQQNNVDLPKDVCKTWQPTDIVLSKYGNLVVSNISPMCLNRLDIFSPDGKLITEFGRANGPGEQTFQKPLHLSVDLYGRILASDYLTNTVQIYDNRGFWLHSVGNCTTLNEGNRSSSHMLGFDNRLLAPLGLTCDTLGNIIVCDSKNKRMAMFASDGRFIENVNIDKNKNPKSHPVSVHIDNDLNILAAFYHSNSKDVFKKVLVKGIKPFCMD